MASSGFACGLFLLISFILCEKTVLGQTRTNLDLEYNGTACAGENFFLACPDSYYIVMVGSSYGRSGDATCTSKNSTDVMSMCNATDVLSTMRSVCDGRQSCSVTIQDSTFGASCANASAYLEYSHICQLPTYKGLQCQEGFLYLACAANQVIHVQNVLYGRDNNNTCSGVNGSVIYDKACEAENASRIVRDLCDGRSYCEMYATDSLFGETCKDVFKYLEVDYVCGSCRNAGMQEMPSECDMKAAQGECMSNRTWMTANCRRSCWQCQYADTCTDSNPNCQYWASFGQCEGNKEFMTRMCKQSCNLCEDLWQALPEYTAPVQASTCQNEAVQLQCSDSGAHIRLRSVFYGVDSSPHCPNVTAGSCPTPMGMFSIVQGVCEGRKECWVTAGSELFGDSCPGVYKEAKVEYSCQKCANAYTDSYCDSWARRGDCQTNPIWMLDNCYKACTRCHQHGCFNKRGDDELCDYYALRGECVSNPLWMSENCTDSCKQCSDQSATDVEVQLVDTCESQLAKLTCPKGSTIRVLDAFFGRVNNDTCYYNATTPVTNCTSLPGTLNALSSLCTGRRECSFDPWITTYPDPCPGVRKSANASYICQECSNAFGDVPCQAMARMGHCNTNREWMLDHCMLSCTMCNATECLNIESDALCDYWALQQQCTNNPTYMNTYCRQSCRMCGQQWQGAPDILNSTMAEVCDNDGVQMVCPIDYNIHVLSVYYGRENNDSCPHENATETNCTTPTGALEAVRWLCEGRGLCWFEALPEVLGDSCPGVPKAASVDYTCYKCANAFSDNLCEMMANQSMCGSEWMTRNCYKTCTRCHVAECGSYAGHRQCDYWTSQGQCQSNSVWMTMNCPSSCGRCQGNWVSYSDKINTTTAEVCEDDSYQLQCPQSGYSIRIDAFEFGYMENMTCANSSMMESDDNCTMSSYGTNLMIALCEGRKQCWLTAGAEIFGDMCPDRKKMAKVTYTCQRCSNAYNDNQCKAMADRGDCATNYPWMLDNCFRSCSKCDQSVCGHYYGDAASCDYWASIGECQNSPAWMSKYCGESCRRCDLWQPPIGFTGFTTASFCQNQDRELVCPVGFNIRARSVFYGRNSETTCPSTTAVTNENCTTPDSAFAMFSGLCDGRRQCWVSARSEVLGDTCPRVYKTASVTFSCQGCANVYSDASCDAMALAGDCVTDRVWMMDNCYKSCSFCNITDCLNEHESPLSCDYWASLGYCNIPTERQFMYENCEESCRTCPQHRVTQPDFKPTKRELFCETELRQLRCDDPGYSIYVDMFYFGRYDNSTCPHSSVVITPMNCPTPANALAQVQALCNGRKECNVEALVEIFGDPCPGVQKAGALDYTCHRCSNAINDDVCEKLAAQGRCQTKPDWMKTNCFKACTLCDQDDCFNEHTSTIDCDMWSMTNQCSVNPEYMMSQCRQSCRKCKELWQEEPEFEATQCAVMCDEQEFMLECTAPGDSLHIMDVFYGFDSYLASEVTCPIGPEADSLTYCAANGTDATTRVRSICNGRRSCALKPSAGIFGDPCQGKRKLAKVQYSCQKCGNAYNDDKCNQWADEGECSRNPAFMIDKCFKACSQCDVADCGNYLPTSEQCDGWAMGGECVSNSDWMKKQCGMSCRRCGREWKQPSAVLSPTSVELCNRETIQMVCPGGASLYTLRINSFLYGRVQGSACQTDTYSGNCSTPAGALDQLRTVCEGRKECHYEAMAETLGDPCPGYNKTARIDFTCQLCANTYSDSECSMMASQGQCMSNRGWMMDNCYQACTGCAQPACDNIDTDSLCDTWSLAKQCTNNSAYMWRNCGKSCRQCGSLWQGTPDILAPVLSSFCMDQDATLYCPSTNYSLVVNRVYYGPDTTAWCSNTTTNTSATCQPDTRALKWVRDVCEGRNQCYIAATKEALGDVCTNRTTILQIDFTCQRCANAYSDSACEQLAAAGACATDGGFMFTNCYKTCSGCGNSDCGNHYRPSSACDYWTLAGECQSNSDWMTQWCGESCRTCAWAWKKPQEFPTQEQRVICNTNSTLLSCPASHYRLWINSVFYGRTSTTVCPSANGQVNNCSSHAEVYDKVQQVCMGRQQCWVDATHDVLGDNCDGVDKYAVINYTCFECINRYDDDLCLEMAAAGECENSTEWMLHNCFQACTMCDERTECLNTHTNDWQCDNWALKEQCDSNPEYMRDFCGQSCGRCGMEWQGTAAISTYQTSTTCAATTSFLSCTANNHYVRVDSVFYGRSALNICPDSLATSSSCSSPAGMFGRVAGLCDGRKSCLLGTYPQVYGNTCPGVSKYLTVQYACQACENAYNESACEAYAANGGCNSQWVVENCYKSCSKCDKQSCGNYAGMEDCDKWASEGECNDANDEWMWMNCAESCGRCAMDWNHKAEIEFGYSQTVCENDALLLTCNDTDHYLYIESVYFGRDNIMECQNPLLGRSDVTNCVTESGAVNKLSKVCSGRQSCWFEPRVDVYGDNCTSVAKIGRVSYSCHACANAYNDTECDRRAAAGQCSTSIWMIDNCYKSCTQCNKGQGHGGMTDVCQNVWPNNVDCDYWALRGQCDLTTTKAWMYINCNASCRACAEKLPTVSTNSTSTTTISTSTSTPAPTTSTTRTVPTSTTSSTSTSTPAPTTSTTRTVPTSTTSSTSTSTPALTTSTTRTVPTSTTTPPTTTSTTRAAPTTTKMTTSTSTTTPPTTTKTAPTSTRMTTKAEEMTASPSSMKPTSTSEPPQEIVQCPSGYKGPDCTTFSCAQLADCNSHGQCSGPNQCTCDDLTTGEDCSLFKCYNKDNCSGNGLCYATDMCQCYPFYVGAACERCDLFLNSGPSCLPCPPCEHGGSCNIDAAVKMPAYIGCFKDNATAPDLSHFAIIEITDGGTKTCLQRCHTRGYQYAGLQNGEQCYCGHTYGSYGQVSDSMCNLHCASGEQGDRCGGVGHNAVWRTWEGQCDCKNNWAGDLCSVCSGEKCEN